MKLSRRLAIFILAVSVFMIFEWIMLGYNLGDGRPTVFYVVHGILIAVNLVIAGALGYIGVRALRSHQPK